MALGFLWPYLWTYIAFLGAIAGLAGVFAVARARLGLAVIMASASALILGLANVAGLAGDIALSGGVYGIPRDFAALDTLRLAVAEAAFAAGFVAWALCQFDAARTQRWGWFAAILVTALVGYGLDFIANIAAGLTAVDRSLSGSPAIISVILATTTLGYGLFVVTLIYGARRPQQADAPVVPQALPLAQLVPPGAWYPAMPAPGWPAYYPPTGGMPRPPTGSPPPPPPPTTPAT